MKSKTISIGTLCMVTFLQAYLLVNVFPYAAYMAVLLWNRDYDEHSISISHLEVVGGNGSSSIATVSGDDDVSAVIGITHENDVDGVPAEALSSMQTSGSDDAGVKIDVEEGYSDESEMDISDTQQKDINDETTDQSANEMSSNEVDDDDFSRSAYYDEISTSDSQSSTEVEESMDKETAVDVGQIMSSEDTESHSSDDSTADSVEVPEIVQQKVTVPDDTIYSGDDFHQETEVPSEAGAEDYVDEVTWQQRIQQQQQQQAQQQQEQQQHEQQIQQQQQQDQQQQQQQAQQQQQSRRLSMNRTLQAKLPNKITVEDAGPYAALLATSFMIGRTIAAVPWGHLADIYGRKWVLIVSLIGSGLASLWFGMCTSYGGITGAVVARGVMGAMNSIVGVSKTMASELAHYDFDDDEYYDCNDGFSITEEGSQSDSAENGELHVAITISSEEQNCNQTTEMQTPQEQLETRIVGLVMSMRAWGFLVAPGIAGFLADPLSVRTVNIDNTINIDTEQHGGVGSLFRNTLEAYPYLLPNLIGAMLCWSTALMVHCGMPETLSECRSANLIGRDFCRWMQNFLVSFLQRCKRQRTSRSTAIRQSPECIQGHYGSLENSEHVIQEQQHSQSTTTSISYIWSLRNTRYHLIAYWYYSLVIIAIDEAFPLYCISQNNGLHGLSEKEIGEILSISGLIFSLFQYKVYTLIVDKWGVYKSFGAGTWLGILPILFIPLACMFTGLNHGVIIYLSLLMGVTKIFQSAFFSSITIATNRTVSKELRSSMNGFGGMGAGIAKAIGPMGVGFWMAYSLSWDKATSVGSFIAFGGLACLGLPLLALLPLLKYYRNED